MLYTIMHPDITSLPPERILLCYNQAKSVAWLELSGTSYISNGIINAGQGVTVHVGARPHLGRWALVDAATVGANRDVRMTIALSDSAKTAFFQRKIIEDWGRFDGNNPGAWAKGTTFGKSFTSASFLMKALKTGFDAIGEPIPAYSGVRVKDFQVEDLLNYLGKRLSQPGQSKLSDGFLGLPAKPFGAEENPAVAGDTRSIPVILSSKPHGGRFAYANEAFTSLQAGGSGKVPFQRVIGYGFRGDTRNPAAIHAAGGFTPNYTRPDHIQQKIGKSDTSPNINWDDDVHKKALDLGAFLANQQYGGYVSTSKSYAIAKHFGTGYRSKPGWVYVCFVEGGFHIPPGGKVQKGVNIPFDEQELAMPGMFDWEDVVAYREVTAAGMFSGDVYIRPTLHSEERSEVFNTIWDLLSGKSQG